MKMIRYYLGEEPILKNAPTYLPFYEEDMKYVMDKLEQLVIKDVKANKPTIIATEIGKQPVISLGNSSGDSSMANYVVNNNKYKSLVLMLCCDDTDRDWGETDKAE